MNEPVDELYFSWLYDQVSSVNLRNPQRTYWSLLRQLHKTEFVWLIPNDDNRVEDGRDLRCEFVALHNLRDVDQNWMEEGCSFFEMLIGLSRRLSFEADGESRLWFWHFVEILEIVYCDHDYNEEARERIDEATSRVIWRTYNYDGSGGLFPLTYPTRDQRDVELWYQLNAYLMERH